MRLVTTCLMIGLMAGSLISSAPADEKGVATLKAAYKKLHEAKTLTFDLAIENKFPGAPGPIKWTGTVTAMKPNFVKVELKGDFAPSFFADGKEYHIVSQGRAQKLPLAPEPKELQGVWEGELDAFYGGEALVDKAVATHMGVQKVGTVDCEIVKSVMKTPDRTAVYLIGQADRLIYRMTLTIPTPNGEVGQTNDISNVKLNTPRVAADFAYKGPAAAADPSEAALLAVGKDAPEFALPTPEGGNVALADRRKGKKAVLVNFWFYG